jgi:CRP-like cAMP-binding protein
VLDVGRLRIWRELSLAAFGIPLDSIDSWVLDRLTSDLREQHVRRGQKLFSAGDVPGFVYFMHEGEVRMEREGSAPWTFRGRWLLGGFEAQLDRPSPRDGVALSDFYVMKVGTSVWVDLLEDSFPLARQALVNSSATVAALEERVPADALGSANGGAPAYATSSLDIVERLAFLSDVPMLRGAGVQTLADLAMNASEALFATGEVVVARGAGTHHVRLVIDGAIHAERENPRVARDYGPGDVVGGVAHFGRSAEAWGATAVAPTRVLQIPIEAWFDLMEEHFDLFRSVLASLGFRREALLEHLAGEIDGLVLT